MIAEGLPESREGPQRRDCPQQDPNEVRSGRVLVRPPVPAGALAQTTREPRLLQA